MLYFKCFSWYSIFSSFSYLSLYLQHIFFWQYDFCTVGQFQCILKRFYDRGNLFITYLLHASFGQHISVRSLSDCNRRNDTFHRHWTHWSSKTDVFWAFLDHTQTNMFHYVLKIAIYYFYLTIRSLANSKFAIQLKNT